MYFRQRVHLLLLMVLVMGLYACGKGGNEANQKSTTAEEVANPPPPQLLLKDKIKAYSEHIGRDPGEIETAFMEKLGANPPSPFNQAWFSFFVATNPVFIEMKKFVPQLWGGLLLVVPVSGDGVIRRIDEEGGDAEREQRALAYIGGFNSTLLLLQREFITVANIFDLKLKAAHKGDFPLPANPFGSMEGRVDAEFKELFTVLLYSASFNVDGQFFSFFQFFFTVEGEGAGAPRPLMATFSLGRLAFVPAGENVFFKELARHGGGDGERESVEILEEAH